MNFKTYFYSLIKESPDTLPNAHWTDPDARAFIVHPDFFCLAMVKGVKHSDMLIKLNELVANHQGNIVQPVKEGGILYQGNFSQIEPVLNFTKNGNRSYLLKYSHHKKLGVLVGRIWVDKKEISFWNNIQDVNLNSINKVLNVIEQYFHRDLSTFTWEVFEKENPGEQPKEATYTLDELEDRLQEDTDDQEYEDVSDHGETAVTQTHGQKNPQWDKLHLTPPDKKGEVMKNMGIMPRKPIDIRDKYKLGMESFKKMFYNILNESGSSEYGPLYHGGLWDGRKPMKVGGRGALGIGGYLTADIAKAAAYAKDTNNPGAKIVECYVKLNKPLIIENQMNHPVTEALIKLGIDKQQAINLVERTEEKYGYIGTQLKTVAQQLGYDALIQLDRDDLEEISELVIWSPHQISRISQVMDYQ